MSTPKDSTTMSIRVSKTLLDRIDEAADRKGITRNTYVLSWLPVNYDPDTPATIRDTAPAING